MLRSSFRAFAAIATRTRRQRASLLVLAFCVLNSLWAVVGEWTINFNRETYHAAGSGWRESGVYSCQGYLVIALRNSFFIAPGVRPRDLQVSPVRQNLPSSVSARMLISSEMFKWHESSGIVDSRPRTIVPGLLINWESAHWEWYNRGIAIHWLLLTTLAALPLTVASIKHLRRRPPGVCTNCGYDLRA